MHPLHDATKLGRDAFYVSVGFGVLGFQKLQVRRRELEKELRQRRAGAVGPLQLADTGARSVAATLDSVRHLARDAGRHLRVVGGAEHG